MVLLFATSEEIMRFANRKLPDEFGYYQDRYYTANWIGHPDDQSIWSVICKVLEAHDLPEDHPNHLMARRHMEFILRALADEMKVKPVVRKSA
jgi:hypothetical protein